MSKVNIPTWIGSAKNPAIDLATEVFRVSLNCSIYWSFAWQQSAKNKNHQQTNTQNIAFEDVRMAFSRMGGKQKKRKEDE